VGSAPPYRDSDWRGLWFKLLPGETTRPIEITTAWILDELAPVLEAKWYLLRPVTATTEDRPAEPLLGKCIEHVDLLLERYLQWWHKVPHAVRYQAAYRSDSVRRLEVDVGKGLSPTRSYLCAAKRDALADQIESAYTACLEATKQVAAWFENPSHQKQMGFARYEAWTTELTQEQAWYESGADRTQDVFEETLETVLDGLRIAAGLPSLWGSHRSPVSAGPLKHIQHGTPNGRSYQNAELDGNLSAEGALNCA
jgi:hypothetical protein